MGGKIQFRPNFEKKKPVLISLETLCRRRLRCYKCSLGVYTYHSGPCRGKGLEERMEDRNKGEKRGVRDGEQRVKSCGWRQRRA